MRAANTDPMSDPIHRNRLPRERAAAQSRRDAALRRGLRARNGIAVGAAGLTAGVAALVAGQAPGRSFKVGAATSSPSSSTRPASAGRSSPRALRLPPLASPGSLGLRGPKQAPAPQSAPAAQSSPTPAPAPPVVSGGS